jgi:WD40 repeat protein
MIASGSHLIMCIGEKVFLLSINTGDVVGRMELAPYTVVHGVDISADGRRLSIATDKQLFVWDLPQALTAGASP